MPSSRKVEAALENFRRAFAARRLPHAVLVSGHPRGAGFDADVDLLNDNSREIAIPINQFLFESYDGHTIRSVAVLAGIFAGCAWLLCPIDARREPSPIDRRINQVVAFALIERA